MITKIQARFFIWAIAFIALAAVAGPLASGASATDAFELFGHDNENSEIEMIDTSTGVETTVGPTGLSSRASAMATSRASADTQSVRLRPVPISPFWKLAPPTTWS